MSDFTLPSGPRPPENQQHLPETPQPRYGQYAPSEHSSNGFPNAPQGPLHYDQLQPGIIPLRPLSVGDILGGVFKLARMNPKTVFGLTFLVEIVLLAMLMPVLISARMGWIPHFDFNNDNSLAMEGTQLVSYLPIFIGQILLIPLMVFVVMKAVEGQKVSIGQTWKAVGRKIWRYLGASIILWLVMMLILVVITATIGGIFYASGAFETIGSGGLAILFLLILGIGILLAISIVAVRFSFYGQAIVIEGAGAFASLKRSWQLMSGYFLRCLGITWLGQFIIGIIAASITTPISAVSALIAVAIGSGNAASQMTIILVLSVITSLLASIITLPLQTSLMSLLYVDVRFRKEGLDVALIQYLTSSGR